MDSQETEMREFQGRKEEATTVEIVGCSREDLLVDNEGYYSSEDLFKAAQDGDLQRVRKILKGGKLGIKDVDKWEVNPLRGVIMANEIRVSVADILLHHFGHDLLLAPREPNKENTLLHLAAQSQREKLAIFFLKYLAMLVEEKKLDPFDKQCFLDATNDHSQTALHIATENLLLGMVRQFVLEKQLKINIKDENKKTVADVIKEKCDSYHVKDKSEKTEDEGSYHMWKRAWKISILLRGSGAKRGEKLKRYEEEEDVMKEERDAQILIRNDEAWNATTNTILLIATLAFTLVFAAIFTVPQTLASGGGGGGGAASSVIEELQKSLGHSTPFKFFTVCLTLACLVMIFVLFVIIFTITSSHDMRALILAFSWLCLIVMGFALIMAYSIAIWIYMGYFFTSILIACGVFLALVLFCLAYYFDLVRNVWQSLSSLLSLTLLHGFVATFLNSYFPKRCVEPILNIFPFEK